MTSSAIFQNTVMKSTEWVAEVMTDLALQDEHKGLRALRAGLHAIRDRLPPEEAVDLAAQLPMLIRGLYYEGWRLADKPARGHEPEGLLAAIRTELHDPTIRAEAALRSTIRVLSWHVSQGEIDDVTRALPRRLAELWADSLV